MRYVVDVNGTRFEVDLDGDTARVDGGAPTAVHLEHIDGSPVRLLALGADARSVHRLLARRDGPRGTYILQMDGWRYSVEALDERTRAIRDLSNAAATASGPRPLIAPMPGLIVRVQVAPGDTVEAGQGIVVMEAMKMENELRAPARGVVKVVRVEVGRAVEKGATLVEFE